MKQQIIYTLYNTNEKLQLQYTVLSLVRFHTLQITQFAQTLIH